MNNIITTLSIEEKKLVKIVDLKKNEILFHEGDLCECVGIVVSGEISIVSYSYHGKELSLAQLRENMLFGNNLIFSSNPYYKGSIIAKKSAKIGLIYKNDVIQLLKNNDEFLFLFLQYQSDIGKSLNSQIKLLSFNSARERFLYYLFINNDSIEFISVTELANSLSLERETTSRLISSSIKEGIIKRNKNKIWLNKNRV